MSLIVSDAGNPSAIGNTFFIDLVGQGTLVNQVAAVEVTDNRVWIGREGARWVSGNGVFLGRYLASQLLNSPSRLCRKTPSLSRL